jgi:hypothetical protein
MFRSLPELPQFPLLNADELEVLRRQKIIRLLWAGGSSYGHQTASLRVAYWLRSNGYKNWIEIVYSDNGTHKNQTKADLETLLGLQHIPDAFYSKDYKIAVLPDSYSEIEYTNLGFSGATGYRNFCEDLRTKIFIGMSPYFWHDPNSINQDAGPAERLRTNIWRLGSDQPSIQERSETLAIRQDIPTLVEALFLLKKLFKKPNNQLPSWLPGIVQSVRNGHFLVMTVYGIYGYENSVFLKILMGMKQAKNINSQFNQKPKLIWVLHKLDEGRGLEELQSKIKVFKPELLPTDVRIIPVNSTSSYVEKTLANTNTDTVIIAETGALPTPIFNAIYVSHDILAVQEGPNSANVLYNAQKAFIRCRKLSADNYWGEIALNQASPCLRKSLVEAYESLCNKIKFNEDLATVIEKNFPQVLGELMSESLNATSELNIFFRKLSIQALTPDRITLALREAIPLIPKNVPSARNPIYPPQVVSLDGIEPLGFPVVTDMANSCSGTNNQNQNQALQLFTPVCEQRNDKQISVFVDFRELLRNRQCQATDSRIRCTYPSTGRQNFNLEVEALGDAKSLVATTQHPLVRLESDFLTCDVSNSDQQIVCRGEYSSARIFSTTTTPTLQSCCYSFWVGFKQGSVNIVAMFGVRYIASNALSKITRRHSIIEIGSDLTCLTVASILQPTQALTNTFFTALSLVLKRGQSLASNSLIYAMSLLMASSYNILSRYNAGENGTELLAEHAGSLAAIPVVFFSMHVAVKASSVVLPRVAQFCKTSLCTIGGYATSFLGKLSSGTKSAFSSVVSFFGCGKRGVEWSSADNRQRSEKKLGLKT